MKNIKSLFLIMLLLFVVSVGCASAADDSFSSVNDGNSNDDIGNFTELQEIVDKGGEINLNKSYTKLNGESGVNITKDVIINGNDFTISANKTGFIFNISSGCSLTLNNVTLTRATATAIINSGVLTMNNTYFLNNKVEALDEKIAIFNNGDAYIYNSEFTTSTIYNNGTLYLTNNKFYEVPVAVYNNGSIKTKIYLKVNSSPDKYFTPGYNLTFLATVADDNGNYIKLNSLNFTYNGNNYSAIFDDDLGYFKYNTFLAPNVDTITVSAKISSEFSYEITNHTINKAANNNSFAALAEQLKPGMAHYILETDYYCYNVAGETEACITISNNMTIDGQGHIIDAAYRNIVFYLTNGATLTLKNITITHGCSYDKGGYVGVIYSNDSSCNVVIDSHVNFIDNIGTAASIIAIIGNITINEYNYFEGNLGYSSLLLSNGTITIKNKNLFYHNIGTIMANNIYLGDKNVFYNATGTMEESVEQGQLLGLFVSGNNIYVNNSNIFYNGMSSISGAFLAGNDLYIGDNNTFSDFSALAAGVIFAMNNTYIGSYNTFANNTATLLGIISVMSNLVIEDNNIFINNSAATSICQVFGNMTIGSNNNFTDNGGVISLFIVSGNVLINNTNTFTRNTIKNKTNVTYNIDFLNESNDIFDIILMIITKVLGGKLPFSITSILSFGNVTIGDYNSFDTESVLFNIFSTKSTVIGHFNTMNNIFTTSNLTVGNFNKLSNLIAGNTTIGNHNKFMSSNINISKFPILLPEIIINSTKPYIHIHFIKGEANLTAHLSNIISIGQLKIGDYNEFVNSTGLIFSINNITIGNHNKLYTICSIKSIVINNYNQVGLIASIKNMTIGNSTTFISQNINDTITFIIKYDSFKDLIDENVWLNFIGNLNTINNQGIIYSYNNQSKILNITVIPSNIICLGNLVIGNENVLKNSTGNIISLNKTIIGDDNTFCNIFCLNSIDIGNSNEFNILFALKNITAKSENVLPTIISFENVNVSNYNILSKIFAVKNITINNFNYFKNITFMLSLGNINIGDYNLFTVYFKDQIIFFFIYAVDNITIGFGNRIINEINIVIGDVQGVLDEDVTIPIRFYDNVGQKLNMDGTHVTVTLSGREQIVEVINGTITFHIPLNFDDEYYYVSLVGASKYLSSEVKGRINVSKASIDLNISNITGQYDKDVSINVSAFYKGEEIDINGRKVTIIFANNKTLSTFVLNDKITFHVPLESDIGGNFTVILDSFGPYASATETAYFNVTKLNTVIVVIADNIVYGDNETFVILLFDENHKGITGSIYLTISGETIPLSIEHGLGVLIKDNISAGNYPFKVIYGGSDFIKPILVNGNFSVFKKETFLNCHDLNILYGEDGKLVITSSSKINGSVRVNIEGKVQNVTLVNGEASLIVGNLSIGSHLVEISLNEQQNYFANNITSYINVHKRDIQMIINAEDISYGESSILYINLDKEINGTAFLSINDIKTNVSVINGKGYYKLEGFAADNYDIECLFVSNDTYTSAYDQIFWKVSKATTNLDLNVENITYGESAILYINLDKEINDIVYLTINNIKTNVSIVDGKGYYKLEDYNAGIYNIAVFYAGNENYTGSFDKTIWKVSKATTNLDLNVENITYGESAILYINLDKEINDIVYLTINNIKTNVSIVDGKGYYKLEDYNAGIYNIAVFYAGNENYTGSFDEMTWKVSKADATLEILANDILYGEDEYITVYVTGVDEINGIVQLKGIYENPLLVNITNNVGFIKLSNLAINNYTVEGIFFNKNYNVVKNITSFEVKNTNFLIVDDLIKYYHDDNKLIGFIVDGYGRGIAGQVVSITINNVTYNKTTNEYGMFSMGVNLNKGVYETIVKSGDLIENINVTVLSTIVSHDITKMYHNDTQFEVLMTDSEGNPLANTEIIFNINGVYYSKLTDENGKAIININLDAGNYTITVFNTYNGEKVSNKITVLPILVGKNLTKEYGTQGAYEVTAYDNQGNLLANATITININGVFYNKITDANGVARLNINLLPGEYIATASYNGFQTSNTVKVI